MNSNIGVPCVHWQRDRLGFPVRDGLVHRPVLRRLFQHLADPQAWRDLVHGTFVSFIPLTVTFPLVIGWRGAAFGGITYWIWGGFTPRRWAACHADRSG